MIPVEELQSLQHQYSTEKSDLQRELDSARSARDEYRQQASVARSEADISRRTLEQAQGQLSSLSEDLASSATSTSRQIEDLRAQLRQGSCSLSLARLYFQAFSSVCYL